ncbi:MAG: serine/threonine protein kinase [Rhodopirellula sp.]|nr:serine/threonine protein kinase [Rhodopirellula sp.]
MAPSDPFPSTRDFSQHFRPIRSALTLRYESLQKSGAVHWTAQYRFLERLGAGSQSVVMLADRLGSLDVSLRVALKLFSPLLYPDTDTYLSEMAQTANVAMKIAEIQEDHLLDVHNFIESSGIQIMVMEWVDGFDLKYLMEPVRLQVAASSAGRERWANINDIVVTAGPTQSRLKPGVALHVLRESLAGLAALHRSQIVHGDIKPSNIMLKRTASTKVIDYGSAFVISRPRLQPAWTPRYAAPEVIESGRFELNSDLASLGYVFLELISGRSPFDNVKTRLELLDVKNSLHDRVEDVLPRDVRRDTGLVELIRGMIHPDCSERFSSPEDADLSPDGAAAAHKRLVLGDLSSEYENDIRDWLQFVPMPV